MLQVYHSLFIDSLGGVNLQFSLKLICYTGLNNEKTLQLVLGIYIVLMNGDSKNVKSASCACFELVHMNIWYSKHIKQSNGGLEA